MRLDSLALACVGAAIIPSVSAYPGMGTTLAQIRARGDSDDLDSKELIGDLATLPEKDLTPVGRSVKKIIIGDEDAESNASYERTGLIGGILNGLLGGTKLPDKNSKECAADKCCIWRHISKDMTAQFAGESGRCTNAARAAVRLGFHDAAGWSKATGPGGGADGSIVLAPEEMQRPDNRGLEEVVRGMGIWHNQYKQYGVSMADMIQMGATVATVVCPLGPRIRSYIGRKDSSVPCPDKLLPGVTDSADFLIEMFENKTIRAHGLTALIGAHSTSQQRFVDESRAGDPQDSTPGVWDVAFYKETLGKAPPRVFRFESDIKLAKHPKISDEFQDFARDQEHWNEDYAREYVRLSMLGVYNINTMTECTKVLPPKINSFRAKDQDIIDKWLSSTKLVKEVADKLLDGKLITGLFDLLKKILG